MPDCTHLRKLHQIFGLPRRIQPCTGKTLYWGKNSRQFPQIGQQYGIKNQGAIALLYKLNVKRIAALLFILLPRRIQPCTDKALYWGKNSRECPLHSLFSLVVFSEEI